MQRTAVSATATTRPAGPLWAMKTTRAATRKAPKSAQKMKNLVLSQNQGGDEEEEPVASLLQEAGHIPSPPAPRYARREKSPEGRQGHHRSVGGDVEPRRHAGDDAGEQVRQPALAVAGHEQDRHHDQ